MENTGGWKVIISVPQLNGANDQHIWVAAISDEAEVRTRLWLDQIPCEAHFERLSLEEFRGLQLERGEVRRILLPWTANPGVPAVNEMAGPEQEPEEHVSLLEETGYPNSGGQSEEAAEDGAWRADRVVTVSPPTDPNDNPDMGSQPEETAGLH